MMQRTTHEQKAKLDESLLDEALAGFRSFLQTRMEQVFRYMQFKLREIVGMGFDIKYGCDTVFEGNKIHIVLTVEIPDSTIERVAETYYKRLREIRKKLYNTRRDEQQLHRIRDVDELVKSLGEEGEEGE